MEKINEALLCASLIKGSLYCRYLYLLGDWGISLVLGATSDATEKVKT